MMYEGRKAIVQQCSETYSALSLFQSCYLKYNGVRYKFNMSSKQLDPNMPRRTSERRRLKMLRNLDQYKISNPFKSLRQIPDVPDDLVKQLKKIDYLSDSAISMLSFDPNCLKETQHDSNLSRMRQAILNQQERIGSILGHPLCLEAENPELIQQDSLQAELRKGHSMGEEVITTREELSINFNAFQQNIFGCREMEVEELDLLESEPAQLQFRNGYPKDSEMVIIDEEYERYFAN